MAIKALITESFEEKGQNKKSGWISAGVYLLNLKMGIFHAAN